MIKIGAESKLELKEKRDRAEDAIYAVKAAIAEGIVPGGGIALLNASRNSEGEISDGETILRWAIQSPFEVILANADTVLMDPVMEAIQMKEGTGVNVVTGEVVNMIEVGIIDPVLVTKTALKNAVSVVSTIISTDTILYNRRAV